MKPLNRLATPRHLSFLALTLCALLIVVATYLENHFDVVPCPLCMAQRVVVIMLGAVFLVTAIFNPRGLSLRALGAFGLLLSLLGVILAARQVWLQGHPQQSNAVCVPGLSYLFTHLPFMDAVRSLFLGSGDCERVVWAFWGLTIPGWTFLFFLMLGVFSASLLWLMSTKKT